jgi:hypothetical protein
VQRIGCQSNENALCAPECGAENGMAALTGFALKVCGGGDWEMGIRPGLLAQ